MWTHQNSADLSHPGIIRYPTNKIGNQNYEHNENVSLVGIRIS